MMAGDLQTAQGIIDAAGVTLPRGDLISGAYDEVGNFYQLPEPIVSDPTNVLSGSHETGDVGAKAEIGEDLDEDEVERRREEKGKGVLKTRDMIKVRARLSDRGGPDVQISMGKDENVRVLVRRVQEAVGVCTDTVQLKPSSTLTATSVGRERKSQDRILGQDLEGWRLLASTGLEGGSCGQCLSLLMTFRKITDYIFFEVVQLVLGR